MAGEVIDFSLRRRARSLASDSEPDAFGDPRILAQYRVHEAKKRLAQLERELAAGSHRSGTRKGRRLSKAARVLREALVHEERRVLREHGVNPEPAA
jgi:hypothetical protein